MGQSLKGLFRHFQRQCSGWKSFVDARGQRRAAKLLQTERKATVTEITTFSTTKVCRRVSLNAQHIKHLSYTGRPQKTTLLLAKNRKLRQKFTSSPYLAIEDWEDMAWFDESQFLPHNVDGRVRMWCKQHESRSHKNSSGCWWDNGVGSSRL